MIRSIMYTLVVKNKEKKTSASGEQVRDRERDRGRRSVGKNATFCLRTTDCPKFLFIVIKIKLSSKTLICYVVQK